MKWSFTGDAPIYAQLMDLLKAGIVTGEFSPGERLPSVRELAAQAGVNPNTMQRSLAELEREGLVSSQRTVGRFVTEDRAVIDSTRRELAMRHIRLFREAMEALGYGPEDIFALLERSFNTRGETNGSSGM